MAAGTQTSRPATLIAGDSYAWTEAAPTGSPDVEAAYHYRGDDPAAYFVASGAIDPEDATQWIFTLTAADTAEMPPGDYTARLIVRGTATGDRTTTDRGALQLDPNPDLPAGETHAARVVRLLEAHIEGRLPAGLESHNIGGQQIAKIPLLEAEQLLTRYRNVLRTETEARKMRDGRGSATVRIQFG